MEIEEIKQTWNNISDRLERLEKENNDLRNSFRAERNRTFLDRLANRYKIFVIVAYAMIIVSFLDMKIFPEKYRLVTSIGMAVYFLIAGSMDLWLYKGIRSIDITRMTVNEVYRKTRYYRRKHLNFILILLPGAFTVFGWFLFILSEEEEMKYGVIIGGAVGLLIGSFQLRRFLNDYRSISK